jgi:hypothetical protein
MHSSAMPLESDLTAELEGTRHAKPEYARTVARFLADRAREQGLSDDAAIDDMRKRFFVTGSAPWPATVTRIRAGEAPDLRGPVLDEIEPRIAAGSRVFPEATQAAWKALQSSLAGIAPGSGLAAAAPASARDLQQELCSRSWLIAVSAFAKRLTYKQLARMCAKDNISSELAEHARVVLVLFAPLVEPGDEGMLRRLIGADLLDPPTSSMGGSDDVDWSAEQDSPVEIAVFGDERVSDRPVPVPRTPAGAPLGPGPRADTEHPDEYLQRLGNYLDSIIVAARAALIERHRAGHRYDTVLDCIQPDGSYDPDEVRARAGGGATVEPLVNRAVGALRRLIASAGFVCVDPVRESHEATPGEKLGARHVLPHGAPVGIEPASMAESLRREIAAREPLEQIIAAVVGGWPAGDAPASDWEPVRGVLSELRRERARLRHAVRPGPRQDGAHWLFEEGLVSPPEQLPDNLVVKDAQGRAGSRRAQPDMDAAVQSGRVLAIAKDALPIEAKTSDEEWERPEWAQPLPPPLNRTHVGSWWFFPHGGVDV